MDMRSPTHPVGALMHACRLLLVEPWRRDEVLHSLPALLTDLERWIPRAEAKNDRDPGP
jgi:hypothetical protein